MKTKLIFLILLLAGIINAQPACDCVGGGCYILGPKHYHRIAGHPAYAYKLQISDDDCSSIEFPFHINVAADGSEASLLEFSVLTNCCGGPTNLFIECVQLDDQFTEIGNNNTYEYGEFTNSGHTGNVNRIRFKHPYKLPENGELNYTFTVKLKSGMATLGYMFVHVYRPPVVMVHGLWSNGGAFQDMETILSNTNEYLPEQLYKADYSSTNASSFSTNTFVVEQAIEQVINQCSNANISVGKVNVVCHSMGGLLTRKYIQFPTYANRRDVYKIITCNTPHGGSQMANFLLDSNNYGDVVAQALSAAGMDCYNGAVSDLRVQNPNIQPINFGSPADVVKVHAITTEAAPLSASPFWNVLSGVSISTYAAILAGYHCGTSFLLDVFDGDQHDQIVAKESQRGGIYSIASSNYTDQAHVGSVANAQVINQVKTLLNQQYISLNNFTNTFNTANVQYDLNFPCLPFTEHGSDSRTNPSVTITSPLTQSEFVAGDTLSILFSSSMVDTVVAALHYDTDSILMFGVGSQSGQIPLPIPYQTFGKKSLVLLGIDAANKIVAMDSISINFITSATLENISLYPATLFMNVNDTLPITITGQYSDGIYRNLNTNDSLEFQFSLGNASRINDHFVRLDSTHSDTLRIVYDNVVSSILVIKKMDNQFPLTCKTVSNTNDGGPGSLRQALECAFDNDTIVFDMSLEGDTILLQTAPLIIDKSIHLINNNAQKVNIKTALNSMLLVTSDVNVKLQNLDFISTNSIPTCISNFGNLILENVNGYSAGSQCLVENQGLGNVELKGICEFK